MLVLRGSQTGGRRPGGAAHHRRLECIGRGRPAGTDGGRRARRLYLRGEVRGRGGQHRLPGACGNGTKAGTHPGTHPGTGRDAGAGEGVKRPEPRAVLLAVLVLLGGGGALAYFKLVKGK